MSTTVSGPALCPAIFDASSTRDNVSVAADDGTRASLRDPGSGRASDGPRDTDSAPGTSNPRDTEGALRQRLRGLSSALVALSGGVDSSVLAAITAQELGARVLAVTGVSPSLPAHELSAIQRLCERFHLEHCTVATHELTRPGYVENSPDRCYHCKTELFSRLRALADERGLAHVLDGTTADDLTSHRPGRRAAQELGVLSPLVEVHATKEQIRAMARGLGLENAERAPSPCLSSRIAYGIAITPARLERVGRAEAFLRTLGFSDVRVRLHDAIARIEVPRAEIALAAEHAAVITQALRALGFVYVTVDLGGLRSGSLLEVLQEGRPT